MKNRNENAVNLLIVFEFNLKNNERFYNLNIRIPATEFSHDVAIITTIAKIIVQFIVCIFDNQSSLLDIYLKEKQESYQTCTLKFCCVMNDVSVWYLSDQSKYKSN